VLQTYEKESEISFLSEITLSVIIPVYNAERYLDECLASVMVQDVEGMEVVVVDDGSTDASPVICDKWAAEYGNLTVYHRSNSGIGPARNFGIDRVRGALIAFVDADDLLHPDMYRTMMNAMRLTDADIVECGIAEFGESISLVSPPGVSFVLKSGRDILLNTETRNIVVWNKIYRGELWNDIRFPSGKIHEDDFIFFRIYYVARNILQLGESFYRYRRHSESITGKKFNHGRLNLLEARVHQVRYFRRRKDPKLLSISKINWYWSLIGLIKLCLDNGRYLRGAALSLQLVFRASWILTADHKPIFLQILKLLSNLLNSREGTFFSSVSDLLGNMRTQFKKQQYLRYLKTGKSHVPGPCIFSLLEASHGNLGDHAIIIGQNELLASALPDYRHFSILHRELDDFINFGRQQVNDNDLIVLPGGGNMGDTYLSEEVSRRKIIQEFPGNTIISFPQSVYFSDTEQGMNELHRTVKVYSAHKRLHLFTRDSQSMDFLLKNLPDTVIDLFPDTALFLNANKSAHRKGVLLCLRNDKEGVLTTQNKISILERLDSLGISFTLTDNHLGRDIKASERREVVFNQIELFGGSKLVITDRLHGMIFSILTGTPCIAIDNSNHKIEAFYNSYTRKAGVRLYRTGETDLLLHDLKSLIHGKIELSSPDFSDYFSYLITLIRHLAEKD